VKLLARWSWWLEEALALPEFAGEPCPMLSGETSADVVVLGGGYTGMWSAYFLKEREPDLDVVLLEQDICGGGPSGRNGGFVNSFAYEVEELERLYGGELGLRIVRASEESVEAIGAWCERHGVDAWFERAGDVGAATSEAQETRARDVVETAARLGVPEMHQALGRDEVRARCDSPLFRLGVFSPDGAGVQPARLARGLRRVLLERGVRIYEQTPVMRFSGGSPVMAETPNGSVHAGRAVVGLNAWARHWEAFRRSLMVRGTYMVITAPAPKRLAEIGWTGGEGLYDFRTSLHYLRATRDGRIAFGGAGLHVTSTRRVDARFAYDERAVRELTEDLHAWFPPFRDVPIDSAWEVRSTSRDGTCRSSARCPAGARTTRSGSPATASWPCHLAGASSPVSRLDVVDDATTLPIVGDRPKPFPAPAVLLAGRAPRDVLGAPQGRARGPRRARRPGHGRARSPAPAVGVQPGPMSGIGGLDAITIDCADPMQLARFWAQVLGTEIESAVGDPTHYVDLFPLPGVPILRFQRVPEPKSVKNRAPRHPVED
jgi:glycine/D-amino acid oxidase-like deaminating enzyme